MSEHRARLRLLDWRKALVVSRPSQQDIDNAFVLGWAAGMVTTGVAGLVSIILLSAL